MPEDKSVYTPMLQQYLTIKENYDDAIVFFRLGDFYEMFFEDAYLASRELEIQLTARDGGAKERVPMCGVPHHAVESYLNRLVEKGYKVAIAEQTEDASQTKKLVKRDVTRVVTPGTNIDDAEAAEHHIATIGLSEYFYTLAYANVATGMLYTMKFVKDMGTLMSELASLPIKEIVVSHAIDVDYIKSYADREGITISLHAETDIDPVFDKLYQHLPTPYEQKTVKRLLSYILKTQKRALLHIKKAERIETASTMKMDANTIRSLELLKTMRQNQKTGSLFWLLDKTTTAMGSRMLKRQLLKPLLDIKRLNTRYDFVDELNKEFVVASELRDCLKNVYDLERIVGRVAYGNANAKDLVQLRRSLSVLPVFKKHLESLKNAYATTLASTLDSLETLHEELVNALQDDVPLTIREGGLIKTGYDEDLDALRDIHLDVKTFLATFEAEEREKTGIKKLKIGYNRVFGYYIEIPKGQIQNVKDDFGYTRKQTLANAERYINETLKEKERIILSSEEKSVKLEYELFIALRDTVKNHIDPLQKNAEIISEVDMFLAFSAVSERYQFVRPTLHESREINIKESVHPVVSTMLEDVFVPNDIEMSETIDVALITGPNMSGKSTYMRQLAVVAILAQIGSFVPAASASLPVFDQLFTRIGASDDLIGGKSTFMVEMSDANHAIQNATEKSLILFDEIGRGTSTYDGLAIARAIIEYIHDHIGCRLMFSTHYHELTQLESTLKRFKNIHVAAEEKDGSITFLHKVKPGRADKSYGINVASLAKLPASLIARSEQLLTSLENNHNTETYNLFTIAEAPAHKASKTSNEENTLVKTIDQLDVDAMTPIEALNTLYQLKQKRKKRQ